MGGGRSEEGLDGVGVFDGDFVELVVVGFGAVFSY